VQDLTFSGRQTHIKSFNAPKRILDGNNNTDVVDSVINNNEVVRVDSAANTSIIPGGFGLEQSGS